MQAARAQSLTLHDFDLSDFPLVWRWLQPYRSHLSHDDSPSSEREFVDAHIARGSKNFGVYRGEEIVGLFICDQVNRAVCEAHVYFKRSFLGWKNTLPALRLGVDCAWNLGYEKITSPVFESNRLMIRLLKELGAIQEARFVGHARQNGQPVNVLYFSIFKENRDG